MRRRLDGRSVSAIELVEAHLERIDRLDPSLGCFLTVDPDGARASAAEAQARLDRGESGPLLGIPVALKDNLSTNGLRTTCASKMLATYVPPYDADAVERLRAAGAVILGKTNLDEFAMGSSTENSAFQPTRNPWDAERSPGGSSGGSAAAVAAELVPLALGSDTGGSVRQPASLCGVVGYKPTYGRCSRYGLVAFASSLDQVGPIARTVEDAAAIAEVVTGHDPRDGTSLPAPPVQAALKDGSLKGKRFALPSEMLSAATEPGVAEVVHRALDRIRSQGAEVDEVSIPSIRHGVATYYIIAPAEASSNLARFDGIRYGHQAAEGNDGHTGVVERSRAAGFGHEVKARIMIGTYALSAGYYDAYYGRAQQVRARMRAECAACLSTYDGLLGPTSPTVAFRLGELSRDPLSLKLLDSCTIPANLGGFPALSLNAGYSQNLPVGIQLMGRYGGDEALLQHAYCIESVLEDATRRPPVP